MISLIFLFARLENETPVCQITFKLLFFNFFKPFSIVSFIVRAPKLPPTIKTVLFSEFKLESLNNNETKISIFYVFILALFGTALAKIIFNKLIKIASPVFASSVTYSMLIVSIFWGIIDGEKFSIYQFIATIIIVFGVILTNKQSSTKN